MAVGQSNEGMFHGGLRHGQSKAGDEALGTSGGRLEGTAMHSRLSRTPVGSA